MTSYKEHRQDVLRSKLFDAIMQICQEEDCSFDELQLALEWVELHIEDTVE